jgi:hypothetical protein
MSQPEKKFNCPHCGTKIRSGTKAGLNAHYRTALMCKNSHDDLSLLAQTRERDIAPGLFGNDTHATDDTHPNARRSPDVNTDEEDCILPADDDDNQPQPSPVPSPTPPRYALRSQRLCNPTSSPEHADSISSDEDEKAEEDELDAFLGTPLADIMFQRLWDDPATQSGVQNAQNAWGIDPDQGDDDDDDDNLPDNILPGGQVDENQTAHPLFGLNSNTTMDETPINDNGVQAQLLTSWLLKTHSEAPKNHNDPPSAEMLCCIELLDLLRKAQAPLYLYSIILKWARKSSLERNIDFKEFQPPGRKALIKELIDRFNLSSLKPQTVPCYLSTKNKEVDLTIFPFEAAVYSILSDPTVFNKNTVNFHSLKEPWTFPEEEPTLLSDINTGSLVREAMKQCLSDGTVEGGRRIVASPLIVFQDEASIDGSGKHSLNPVFFTLSILDQETRRKPEAWRCLGYIKNGSLTDMKTGTPHVSVERDKKSDRFVRYTLIDLHDMLNTILKSLKSVQSAGGLDWDFQWTDDDDPVKVRLVFPLLFIMGDTEGHNKLACIRGGPNTHNPKCRYCDIPFDETDNPWFSFNLTSQKELRQKVMVDNDFLFAKKKGYYGVTNNAFWSLLFCDNERGIHGATPAEVLHQFLLGYLLYLLTAVVCSRRRKACARGQRSKSAAEADKDNASEDEDSHSDGSYSVYEGDGGNTGGFSVFSTNFALESEVICARIGRALVRQSDRTLPRTYFPTGILIPAGAGKGKADRQAQSTGKKTAEEMPGVILVIFLYYLSGDHSEELRTHLGETRRSAFLAVMELCLLLYQWMIQTETPRTDIYETEEFMPLFMDYFKRTIERDYGHGMKNFKIHSILHVCHDMIRLGTCDNYNSKYGEKNHKENVKAPGRKTQMRAETFIEQTADRTYEDIVITRARRQYLTELEDNDDNEVNKYPDTASGNPIRWGPRLSFQFRTPGNHEDVVVSAGQSKKKTPQQFFGGITLDEFIATVAKPILEQLDPNTGFLETFTELYKNGEKYRAHPYYRPKDKEPGWQDWAFAKGLEGEFGEEVPVHLLIYIGVEGLRGSVQTPIGTMDRDGLYAVVHWTIQSIDGKVTVPIYGQEDNYSNYMVDGNCSLVKWSCKKNKAVGDPNMNGKTNIQLRQLSDDLLKPMIGIIPISKIFRPCIAIHDPSPLTFPHEYLFIASMKDWPKLWMDKVRDADFKVDYEERMKKMDKRAEQRKQYLETITDSALHTDVAKENEKKRKRVVAERSRKRSKVAKK